MLKNFKSTIGLMVGISIGLLIKVFILHTSIYLSKSLTLILTIGVVLTFISDLYRYKTDV